MSLYSLCSLQQVYSPNAQVVLCSYDPFIIIFLLIRQKFLHLVLEIYIPPSACLYEMWMQWPVELSV
jgi:hypothetical protein